MNIDVYAVCWNESFLMPYFMRHYKTFARNIFIYDNYSTDGCDQIAEGMGARVIYFGNDNLDDREYLKVKNNAWKGTDADWIICCDLDEFIYHPDLVSELTKLQAGGVTLPNIEGYNVYSESLPNGGQIYDSIDTGFPSTDFTKQIIFNPKIREIDYAYGCHENTAKGIRGGKIYMIHYRCIGGVESMISRHKMYAARMSRFNKTRNLGVHYLRSESEIRNDWSENIKKAEKLLFLRR